MIKLGKDPRGIKKGIVGYGQITSRPFIERHWDTKRAESGKTALRVYVKFLGLNDHPFISSDELERRFQNVQWMPQAGGVEVPDDVAGQIFTELGVNKDLLSNVGFETIIEVAIRKITIRSYDRNSIARQMRIEAHGFTCAVCGFNYEDVYGQLGYGCIEVHHLKPISSYDDAHPINPVEELRPVCANCHRMIHKKNPPLAIEELSEIIVNSRIA